MDIFDNDLSIPINLIRQWCFCPRVVYYQELLAIKPHKPLWVAQGEEFHKKVEHLEKRRNFSRYGLDNAIRHFNVTIKSQNYKLHGIVDWVLETDNNVYVVEYKTNPNPNSLGHKLQIAAYALLAQEYFAKPCKTTFLTSDKKSYEIKITDELITKLVKTVNDILNALDSGNKPDSSASDHQCIQCEYLNFCNDR
ncbi:CRISPR-associated protein Cas4 [Francisella hispaniensis]|uniref:CRISPR-associated protein Cas4 n=1 Tax=Francisella hispaniensis TaxID=622488 RepID=UPI00190413D2|nr:CRISPR-associated protein Cas4 [Francisella hispaniensis]MBK2356847.1 CRISPR-associated protein Cas4 [Francisella hispaniensis]